MTTPALSVIIAATSDERYLDRCLDSLTHQDGDASAEVIVCARSGSGATRLVERKYPEVRVITVDPPASVAELRARGFQAARGEIIAMTEDHCIAPPNWFLSIRAAHLERPNAAIGGAVDNGATDRLIDWAVFLCEYSNFISPASHGIVHDLPGPNVSYKRDALMLLNLVARDEFWETAVHGNIEQSGSALWSDPSMRILHRKHFSLWSFLSERYHYSRAYAGRRTASMTPVERISYTLRTPLLPPILLQRISRRALSRRGYAPIFLRTLPYLILFMCVWAWGEAVGYLFGAGESALHLE